MVLSNRDDILQLLHKIVCVLYIRFRESIVYKIRADHARRYTYVAWYQYNSAPWNPLYPIQARLTTSVFRREFTEVTWEFTSSTNIMVSKIVNAGKNPRKTPKLLRRSITGILIEVCINNKSRLLQTCPETSPNHLEMLILATIYDVLNDRSCHIVWPLISTVLFETMSTSALVRIVLAEKWMF